MKLFTFVFTLVVVTAGAVLAGRVSDDFTLAMVVTAAWFAVVLLVALLVIRARRRLLAPIAGGLAVVGIGMTVLVGLPTLFGKSVDEEVVVGTPQTAMAAGAEADAPAAKAGNVEVSAGGFVSVAHEGRGKAAVVRLPDGRRKLTLTGFETDSGPDLRLYLTTDDPAKGGGIGEFVDLGALKGNRGDQQYDLARRVDLRRYPVVVVWCRAFSVPFTSAALRAHGDL